MHTNLPKTEPCVLLAPHGGITLDFGYVDTWMGTYIQLYPYVKPQVSGASAGSARVVRSCHVD